MFVSSLKNVQVYVAASYPPAQRIEERCLTRNKCPCVQFIMLGLNRCLRRNVLCFLVLCASSAVFLCIIRFTIFAAHPKNYSADKRFIALNQDIPALTKALTTYLSEAEVNRKIVPSISCDDEKDVRRPCVNKNCTKKFPSSSQDRLLPLLQAKFQLPVAEYASVTGSIGNSITSQEYIFLTAASANHFGESEALLKNLRVTVFPQLQNYILVFVDLGLNQAQKQLLAKQGGVRVVDFPFQDLPPHVSTLWCYSWKPLIIQALLPKTRLLIYMDSSVRFLEKANVTWLFQRARERGLQFLRNPQSIFLHTVDATFTYYDDLACQYQPFPEVLAGFGVYHNEDFVRKAVVTPWASCALVPECMCPVDPSKYINCDNKRRANNVCHRFDLSSLTIQLAKLYQDKLGHIIFPPRSLIGIDRGTWINKFDEVMRR